LTKPLLEKSFPRIFNILLFTLYAILLITFPLLLTAATVIFYIFYLKAGRLNKELDTELGTIEEEANVLSVELEHLRTENSALRQKLQRYTTLKSLTERLSASLALDETVSLITAETSRIIGKSDACLLYLLDREKQELNLAGSMSRDSRYEIKLKKGDVFDNWVFKQCTRLMIMDTKKDFRFNLQDVQGPESRNVRSLIAAPLISQNKLRGILRLDNISPDIYDAGDLRLLDIISDLSVLAIENTQFYQKTEKLAITDGLTGLLVHRHFQERFEQEISRAVWTKSGFAFLMLDIDNFKSYNDKYGHIAGDIVLKQIAALISAGVNPGDIVARYGGEEFGVLLVDVSEEEAVKIAEGIRRSIEEEKFVLRREITEVRISGGLAFFPADGKEREELIQRADRALYNAKSEGKNRICRL
jgi:diguanylate cyclase (GGDEF)-like protein